MTSKPTKSVPIPDRNRTGQSMQPFVTAVCALHPSESVTFDYFTSAHRQALSILRYALSREFCCRTEKGLTRVWRVS